MARVLIIDDDRVFCDVLTRAIRHTGHNSIFCLTLAGGLEEVSNHAYDVVLLDVQLPDGNGLKAIEKIRAAASRPEVVIITGLGDPDGAELAIRWGAWDYIEKPASTEEITLPIIRALEYRREKRTKTQPPALNRRHIVGESPLMKASLAQVAIAAGSDVNVLITGETGTGKEVFARTIHENSHRAGGPFVVVDCGALPEPLVESMLFGHAKGAFTGADRAQPGLIKQADGGTLFLDEIGELQLCIQKAFLRVLQERRFRPVGYRKEEKSDFRLIAATNRDLERMAAEGSFRSDLLFRLRAYLIDLPPLRDRLEDIKDLAVHTVASACDQSRTMMKGFSSDFFEVLKSYDWPGNVRELMHVLQSTLAAAGDEPILYPAHLPIDVRAKIARHSIQGRPDRHLPCLSGSPDSLPGYRNFRSELVEKAEEGYFRRVVQGAEGSISRACRITGLSRSRLYFFLQKYGLHLSHPRESAAQESPCPDLQDTQS